MKRSRKKKKFRKVTWIWPEFKTEDFPNISPPHGLRKIQDGHRWLSWYYFLYFSFFFPFLWLKTDSEQQKIWGIFSFEFRIYSPSFLKISYFYFFSIYYLKKTWCFSPKIGNDLKGPLYSPVHKWHQLFYHFKYF